MRFKTRMAQLSLCHSLAGDGEKEERKRWGSNQKQRMQILLTILKYHSYLNATLKSLNLTG